MKKTSLEKISDMIYASNPIESVVKYVFTIGESEVKLMINNN